MNILLFAQTFQPEYNRICIRALKSYSSHTALYPYSHIPSLFCSPLSNLSSKITQSLPHSIYHSPAEYSPMSHQGTNLIPQPFQDLVQDSLLSIRDSLDDNWSSNRPQYVPGKQSNLIVHKPGLPWLGSLLPRHLTQDSNLSMTGKECLSCPGPVPALNYC